MDIEQSFIVANTLPICLEEIKQNHIIPVFAKDNHPLISQSQLVEATLGAIDGTGLKAEIPQIRVSHPIMGRIPEARFKKAAELLPHEITIYYERMIYLLQIPEVKCNINGQDLTLVVGGVKSYSWDNLGRDRRAQQHFKFFAGFQVHVCSNLCVTTDGTVLDFRTHSLNLVISQVKELLKSYEPESHLKWLQNLGNYAITDAQFAHFIGRCRMKPYYEDAPEMALTDSQVNSVVKGYYSDPNFSQKNEEISLWSLYNLLTEANKSSYIDGFLDRGVNAMDITDELIRGLEGRSWYLPLC